MHLTGNDSTKSGTILLETYISRYKKGTETLFPIASLCILGLRLQCNPTQGDLLDIVLESPFTSDAKPGGLKFIAYNPPRQWDLQHPHVNTSPQHIKLWLCEQKDEIRILPTADPRAEFVNATSRISAPAFKAAPHNFFNKFNIVQDLGSQSYLDKDGTFRVTP